MKIYLPSEIIELRKGASKLSEEPLIKGPKRSLKPPAKWWARAIKGIKASDKSLSEESIVAIAGKTWSSMSEEDKKKARKAEGKEYGEPVKKSLISSILLFFKKK